MSIKYLAPNYAVSSQLSISELPPLAEQDVSGIICLRPDGEELRQPSAADIGVAAEECGLAFAYVPVKVGVRPDPETVERLRRVFTEMTGPDGIKKVVAYCQSGGRAVKLYEMMQANAPEVRVNAQKFDVVIVGGGAGGLSTASSLLKRRPDLLLAIIEPSEVHDYQPGWTLVGAGVLSQEATRRFEVSLMPSQATWIHQAVTEFHPEENYVCVHRMLHCQGIDGDKAILTRQSTFTHDFGSDLRRDNMKQIEFALEFFQSGFGHALEVSDPFFAIHRDQA